MQAKAGKPGKQQAKQQQTSSSAEPAASTSSSATAAPQPSTSSAANGEAASSSTSAATADSQTALSNGAGQPKKPSKGDAKQGGGGGKAKADDRPADISRYTACMLDIAIPLCTTKLCYYQKQVLCMLVCPSCIQLCYLHISRHECLHRRCTTHACPRCTVLDSRQSTHTWYKNKPWVRGKNLSAQFDAVQYQHGAFAVVLSLDHLHHRSRMCLRQRCM